MRICFFSLNAYPTLAETREARVGGAEVQQTLISRYLAKRGAMVSFVTRDHGQPDGEVIDGIRVFKSFRQSTGLPYLRFVHPRWTGAWKALRRADADVYYQRCAGMETGLLALFCRAHGRKFVFASASDADFDLKRVITASRRDTWLYVYGLKRADAIVTQTRRQQDLLARNFGLNSEVIHNCWERETDAVGAEDRAGNAVLWVSTLRGWKHPEHVPELARRLPGKHFIMAGGEASGEGELFARIAGEARDLANMDFTGFVPFAEVGRQFDRARIVINTSEAKEGFPNAFLQAWQRGIPVVSYFDPDGIIGREGLGYAVNTIDEMVVALSALDDEETYRECSLRALRYFEDNHLVDVIGARYEKLFRDMC